MSTFRYQSRDVNGKIFSGQLEAANQQMAVQILRQRGLWITKLSAVDAKKNGDVQNFSWQIRWQFASLPRKRLVLFYRQVSVLLSAGLPIHEVLRAISSNEKDSAYEKMLQALLKDLLSGISLSKAMAKLPCFSPVTIELVRAGEAGGSLEEIFVSLANYEEKSYRLREKVKSLLIYPAILFVTTFIAFVFLTLFILPAFANMLMNLQAELPLPTKILLFVADFLQNNMSLCVFAVTFSIFALILLYRYPKTRFLWDKYKLFLPFWGNLQRGTAWLMILRTFAVLLASGLPVHKALGFAGKATGNLYLQAELELARKNVERGKSLGFALANIEVFPQILRELLQAGEYAGELEKMLDKAVDFCTMQVDEQAKRMEAMAEPVALFIVGGFIFFFVLSIVLPLLGTMDVLG